MNREINVINQAFWVMDEVGTPHLVKEFDPDKITDWSKFFSLMLSFSKN